MKEWICIKNERTESARFEEAIKPFDWLNIFLLDRSTNFIFQFGYKLVRSYATISKYAHRQIFLSNKVINSK